MKILQPYVRHCWNAVAENYLFVHDIARPHETGLPDEHKEPVHIWKMDCPDISSGMSQIKYIWNDLERLIGARDDPHRILPKILSTAGIEIIGSRTYQKYCK